MSGTKTKYKRSRYVVDKKIQYRFVGLLFFYMLALFFISVLIVYFSGWKQLIRNLANVYPQAVLVGILNSIYLRLLIAFLLLLPLAAVSAILVSHKIAGPLVRIKKALERLTDGERDLSVKLRKNDSLQDIADQINKLAKTLKKKNV